MGEKVDSILYSLLPLILIVAVSWFFSFLGAKAKQQTQQAPEQPHKQPAKDSMDLVFGESDDMESPVTSQRYPDHAAPTADSGATLWRQQGHQPEVTPEPIKPKWWGA
jgi:hypothetical protein